MTSSTSNAQRPLHPRPLAWVACALSLLALIGMFGAIDLGDGLTRQLHARDLLEQSLQTVSDDSVRANLATISQARQSTGFFGLLSEPPDQQARREQLIELALSLRAALLSEDTARIKTTELDLDREFLAADRLKLPHAQKLVNIQRLLRENLTAHQRIIDEIGRQRDEQSQLNEETTLLTSRYQLLQGDVNELFSLNLKLRPRVENFSFYRDGALSGLPLIYDLPDNLSDYVSLRVELDRIGGKVRIEGDNASQLFAEKLEQLRTQSSEIESAWRSLSGSLSEIEKALDALKNERKNRRERLLDTLASLIITLSDWELST